MEKEEDNLTLEQRKPSLEQRHEHLEISHTSLKSGIQRSVINSLAKATQVSSTSQKFVNQSMATVAAWMLSQTCYLAIAKASSLESTGVSTNVDNLVSRFIYAVLCTIAVPLLQWALRNHKLSTSTAVLADQLVLLNLCLPMFFAWAWKDVVGAFNQFNDGVFWVQLVVALSLVLIIAVLEMVPWHRHAIVATKVGGAADTPCARILAMPASLGLAVGYSWNAVLSYPSKEAKDKTNALLFKMMIQIAYYFVVTAWITTAWYYWNRHVKNRKENKEQRDIQRELEAISPGSAADRQDPSISGLEDVKSMGGDFVNCFGQILMDSLTFVFAWALLDTVNALFFVYLAQCASPTSCTYQSNFGFAAGLTFIFMRLSQMLKEEKRISQWNQANADLTNKSLSLNVGWAWSNYCSTAIVNAVRMSGLGAEWTYVICSAFTWVFISIMHRKYEIERRAWDRHVSEETMNHGLGQTLRA
mmetsp:Transcript_100633/g.323091  ORF Transcript_100633/g.323091 Transcript_100633/m.323091 type:complete len:473 (-) Transcript_100633:122-1540(-)